jgi:hypothetical protein
MSDRNRPGTVYRPSPEVVTRDIAGQHLFVPVRTGVAQMDYLYTADEIGSFIYASLDGRRDAAALAALVAREFEVDQERALTDVLEFLAALRDAGLASEEPAAP